MDKPSLVLTLLPNNIKQSHPTKVPCPQLFSSDVKPLWKQAVKALPENSLNVNKAWWSVLDILIKMCDNKRVQLIDFRRITDIPAVIRNFYKSRNAIVRYVNDSGLLLASQPHWLFRPKYAWAIDGNELSVTVSMKMQHKVNEKILVELARKNHMSAMSGVYTRVLVGENAKVSIHNLKRTTYTLSYTISYESVVAAIATQLDSRRNFETVMNDKVLSPVVKGQRFNFSRRINF